MSIHYFYNFREDLVKGLNDFYKDEIKNMLEEKKEIEQLDHSEELIRKYFKVLKKELEDVIEATNGDVFLIEGEEGSSEIIHFKILGNYIKFKRAEKSIEVRIGYYVKENDMIESKILCYIVPGDKKAKVKRIGKAADGSSFDDGAINHYLREAFGDLYDKYKETKDGE